MEISFQLYAEVTRELWSPESVLSTRGIDLWTRCSARE